MTFLHKDTLAFIKSYGINSLFFKYLKKTFIICFLPFLITTTSLFAYYGSVTKTKLDTANLAVFQSASKIVADVFDAANNIYYEILMNNDQTMFTFPLTLYNQDINKVMGSALLSSNYFTSVYLYSAAHDYVYSSTGGNYRKSFYDLGWFEHNADPNINPYIIKAEEGNDFYICYSIFEHKEHDDMLVLRINGDGLTYAVNQIINNESTSFFITDSFSERSALMLGHNTPTDLDYDTINKQIKNMSSENEQVQDISINKNKYLFSGIFQNRIFMFINYPNVSIFKSLPFFVPVVICGLFLLIVLPLLLSFYLSSQYYRSIMDIVQYLSDFNSSDEESQNELTFIRHNVMQMLSDNNALEKKLSEKIVNLKKAQYQALQFQINPHFLFNSLNVINFMVMKRLKGDSDISDMIINLSDLLTISLNTSVKFITLREEISYLKKYIEIEKIRYESNFDILWKLDDRLLDNKTIKLITQPIIENSFYHGIANLSGRRKTIEISISEGTDGIYIIISDNGNGIAPDKLRQIQNQLESDVIPEKHIGIANVNSRIKLTFGQEYGCGVASSNSGTTVTIKIPKI